ncbi:MAG TPA: hypothetical protein PLO88_04575 [Bacilli bacterium]|nr:MAG: hypothetical protein BWY97_01522 [Tenericutes bacterium ADurb.BinA124]HPN61388.1 hypothetical protein [Bacilli bacterium]HPX84988.1 hypothetical protein [Bacilli bacterium]HQC74769.1 hypothetical protein [Bacilli bacterium]
MKWSLQQLHKYLGRPFTFETTYDFSQEIENLDDVIAISEIHVTGTGKHLFDDCFTFALHIVGNMTLEDARTLDPVIFPIDIHITETFNTQLFDDDSRLIEKNTVDLRPVVWEDIYLEKPMRVVKEEIQNNQN